MIAPVDPAQDQAAATFSEKEAPHYEIATSIKGLGAIAPGDPDGLPPQICGLPRNTTIGVITNTDVDPMQ